MSQRKEKYARAMERRVDKIEEEMRMLCRDTDSIRFRFVTQQEFQEETRRLRSVRRRAENAEWSAAIWKTVAIAAVCTAIVILVMAFAVILTGAETAAAVTARTGAQPAVQVLGDMEPTP